jgi:hypothetical protein
VRTWFRGLTARRSVHRRRLAQGLVEYGMIVAAVAFVGMVGLQFVGRAEESLLGGEPLASTPPVAGFFLHPTSTTISCASSYIAGTALNCTATVDDTFLPVAQAFSPGGSVRLRLDATQIATCTLLPVGGTHYSQCALSYTFAQADSGSHNLVADYFGQTTNHNTSSSTPLAVTVAPKIGFIFQSCTNPWVPAWSFQAAIGQPLICRLKVVDGTNPTIPWNAGQPVHVTASNAGGYPFFSCFVDYANDTSPGHANSLAAINSCSQPQGFMDCVTIAGGWCVWQGKQEFEYRRTLDDNGVPGPVVSDWLMATALGQSGRFDPITLTPQPAHQPINIVAFTQHRTGTTINCVAPVSPGTLAPGPTGQVRTTTSPPITVDSVANIYSPVLFTVACTATVMDLNPNTAFDLNPVYPTCNPIPDPRACNVDDVDVHPPLGTVTFTLADPSPCPCPPAVPIFKGQQTCTLGPGPANPAPPASYVPPHPAGQIRYVSHCSVNLSFPAGIHWTVVASYGSPLSAHLPSSAGSSFASPDMEVDVP